MYHPLLRDFQKVLNEPQILVAANEEHKTVFGEKPPMIGWHKACTFQDYLVRAKINNVDTKEEEFEDTDGNKYNICKEVINWNTDFIVYKFNCSSCSKQYVGRNITDFRYHFNNYKSAFRKVSKSGKPTKVNEEHFHQHFKLPEHNGMGDWRVTLTDRADNRKELRRRESFW